MSSFVGRDSRSLRYLGWLAVAAVAAFPLVEAVRILVRRPHVVLYGDQALLELGARRAVHFDQLLGPYSRDGFHQPGPALLYLLAPFVRLLEPAGSGLYLGAVVLNGAALTATVIVLWRRLGPLVAIWAAVAIDLYCLCVGVGTLREPWNPYLIVAPMVLFVVLWAVATTGSRGAGVWAVVVGSYEAQTHIAAAGFVVALLAGLAGWVVWHRWRRPPVPPAGRTWGPARITGAVALIGIWLPPVIELWRDQPNNARLLWDFFTSSQPAVSLPHALKVAAAAVTIVPFGNHDYVLVLNRTGPELAVGLVLLVVGFAIAVVLGRRRRQPMAVALATAAVMGSVVGSASLTRTAGVVYPYFAVWLAVVPLSILLAIGVALLGPAPTPTSAARPAHRRRLESRSVGRGRVLVSICIAASVAAGALTVTSDLGTRGVQTTTGSGPWPQGNAASPRGKARTIEDTAALADAAKGVLEPTDRWVNLTIGTASLWPYAAGIVLELDEAGVQSTVSPSSWDLYFGSERRPGRPVNLAFDLFAASDTAARMGARGTIIANLHGEVLTYRRSPGR
jgi:hypothetical protein